MMTNASTITTSKQTTVSLPSEIYAIIISYASNRYTHAVKLQLVSKEWRELVYRYTVGLRFETEKYALCYLTPQMMKQQRWESMPNENLKMIEFSKALVRSYNHVQVIDCTDAICSNESVEIMQNIIESKKNTGTTEPLTHLYIGGCELETEAMAILFRNIALMKHIRVCEIKFGAISSFCLLLQSWFCFDEQTQLFIVYKSQPPF